jgi:hypothetical protein
MFTSHAATLATAAVLQHGTKPASSLHPLVCPLAPDQRENYLRVSMYIA